MHTQMKLSLDCFLYSVVMCHQDYIWNGNTHSSATAFPRSFWIYIDAICSRCMVVSRKHIHNITVQFCMFLVSSPRLESSSGPCEETTKRSQTSNLHTGVSWLFFNVDFHSGQPIGNGVGGVVCLESNKWQRGGRSSHSVSLRQSNFVRGDGYTLKDFL